MIQHFLEANATHVAICRSINRVTERHIVRRHRLGDGSGCATDPEEAACYFLAGSDLCKSAVLGRVQIDLQRLLVGAYFHFWIHTISLTAIFDRRKHPRAADCRASMSDASAVKTIVLARRSSPESSRGDCLVALRRPSRRAC